VVQLYLINRQELHSQPMCHFMSPNRTNYSIVSRPQSLLLYLCCYSLRATHFASFSSLLQALGSIFVENTGNVMTTNAILLNGNPLSWILRRCHSFESVPPFGADSRHEACQTVTGILLRFKLVLANLVTNVFFFHAA
jgi:hypothetical protein